MQFDDIDSRHDETAQTPTRATPAAPESDATTDENPHAEKTGDELEQTVADIAPPHVNSTQILVPKAHASLAMKLYEDTMNDVEGAAERLSAFVHKLFSHI